MRNALTHLTIAATAGATALAMLLVNNGFEAAGSVPDYEGAGYLAGSLPALLVLYPLAAALVASRTARPLARRTAYSEPDLRRIGLRGGIAGAALYLCLGVAASRAAHLADLAVWLPLFLLAAGLGGRYGAGRAARVTAQVAWESGPG